MSVLTTQTNSRTRVKEDGIGESRMLILNSSFNSASLEDFKTLCLEAVDASSGKASTKTRTADAINRCTNKSKMLFIVTNYFLAGEGRGV